MYSNLLAQVTQRWRMEVEKEGMVKEENGEAFSLL